MGVLNLFIAVVLLAVALVASGAEDDFETKRRLGGKDVAFNQDVDECKIGEDDKGRNIYGPCDPNVHFPACQEGKTFICYNRVNRRDKFHPDKQPHYYIDPRRIHCYPEEWVNDGGCSTCTPGRYCLSENRCIIDEYVYPCETWL